MARPTTDAPLEPVNDVENDEGMECGIADLSPPLIATVSGNLDHPIIPAPEIGRGFFSSSLQVSSVAWQSTSAEQLAVASSADLVLGAGGLHPR